MPEQIDKEVDAIKAVLSAIEPLSATARTSVLEYVIKRLQVSLAIPAAALPAGSGFVPGASDLTKRPASDQTPDVTHIKQLKELKKPRSANEMAALVAYFLGEMVPANERRRSVNAKDIETQFKIAGFPLPDHVQMTLPNAKAAGYFDAAGEGDYRLNAVGHNLVAHSMPRGAAAGTSKSKRQGRKTASNIK